MEMIIENRIRLKIPSDILKKLLVEKLSVANPKYQEAVSSGRSIWNIDKYINSFTVMPDGSFLVPRGIRQWVLGQCQELDVAVNIRDNRMLFDFIDINSKKISYRPYQLDAVLALTISSPEGVLVAPAGSGKTVMGLSLVPLTGQPTMWLTHTGALARQTTERAKHFLPDIGDIGMIGGGKWVKGDTLTIAMIQTLIRNPDKLVKMMNDFGLVILDEAHHCPARTFLDVVSYFNPYYIYGLTATPYRRDRLEQLMFQTLGESKTVVPFKEVESSGGIISPTVICKNFDSEYVDNNDIQSILKNNIVLNTKRNHVITKDVLREARGGHYCIIISDRRAHCEILYEMISNEWKKTGIATGKYSKKYVGEQVERFNNNEITVLVATFALLGEGFDIPFLDRGFVSMPFRAEAKAEQLVGRLQRTSEGKKDAVLYDYIDTNIGVLRSQFRSKSNNCRHRVYTRLGLNMHYC